jgi:crotonobetainyl-CoA:carnitine CoA-transferase CaiB-like acyl-CoA transferase
MTGIEPPSSATAQFPEHDDEAPLAGLKVVELSMYVQGPVAGLALASLGADVVKIERVGHMDQMRSFTSLFGVDFDDRGREWLFSSLNRNKRGLALDITSEGGRPVFHRMIEQADVFVTNMRADGLLAQGADAETLLAINPQLVYCRGAGFGMRGPMADDPCQDTVGMAFGGFMDSTSPNEVPNYPPGSMSDVLTGTNMASAVMAGLLKRARTGRGCVVGTSQTQSLLWMQLQGVGMAASLGLRMERFKPDETTNPLFTVYRTSDGWLAIAALRRSQWLTIATVLGLEHLLADPRFATFDDITTNRDEFRPIFSAHLATKPTEHWWEVLRAADIWVSPVNRLEDLANNDHIAANEYLVSYDDGFVGPPAPFEVDNWRGARGEAATYGQHTDAVLSELGYDEDEILMLKATDAVW